MRTTHRILALGLLAALPSCGTIRVEMPPRFLVTQESALEFKATTAGEAIFWVERFALPKDGDNLGFWVDALKKDFVDNRGYTLLESEKVTSNASVTGEQMTFEATVDGRPYRYLVVLFVRPGPVACVARFTAEKSEFAEHLEAVKKAILTTRD